MSDRTCPYCGGDGGQSMMEGRRHVFDACYACGTTGRVSEDRYQQYRLEVVIDLLAARVVDDQRDACNSNPEGEGWDFHAAENGMSGYEYTQAKFFDYKGRVAKQVRDIDPVILEDIKDRLSPDDPMKTVLFRRYTRKDFPDLEESFARTLVALIHPPQPTCSTCGAEPPIVVDRNIASCGTIEDDGSIPF